MKMKDLLSEGRNIQETFKKKSSLNEGIFGDMIKSIIKKAATVFNRVELDPKILLIALDDSFLPKANDEIKRQLYPKINDKQKAKLETIFSLIRNDLALEIKNGWITTIEELGKRYTIVSTEKMKNFR